MERLYIVIVFTLVCFRVSIARAGDIVPKCCKKGEKLDAKGQRCVQMSTWNENDLEKERLQPPINDDKGYWLPSFLRNRSIDAEYHQLYEGDWSSGAIDISDATEPIVLRLMVVKLNSRKSEVSPFKGLVDPISVLHQSFCLDAIDAPSPRFVYITWVYLRYLNKCCSKDERLNPKTGTCEKTPERRLERNIYSDVIRPNEDKNSSQWVPQGMRSNVLKVGYGRRPYNWNVLMNADDANSWKIISDDSGLLKLWVRQNAGNSITGVTKFFCFDEAAGTGPYNRVFLALVTNITKCCRKGEALSVEDTKCVKREVKSEDPDVENVRASSKNSSDLIWLPQEIRSGEMIVKYGSSWHDPQRVIYQVKDSIWTIQYREDEETTLTMTFSLPSGNTRVLQTQQFCFENLSDRPSNPRVIIATFNGLDVESKCCPVGERLGPGGSCGYNPSDDWSVASLPHYSNYDRPMAAESFHLANCRKQPFDGIENISKATGLITGFADGSRVYCYDLQLTIDGSIKDVVAYCDTTPSAELYKSIRPLHVVYAVLLVALLVAILSERRMRCSTHGQALGCYITCLLVVNCLQAAWFFTSEFEDPCDNFAFFIYYFMMAAAFWLNAVVVNMAYGFSKRMVTHGKRLIDKKWCLMAGYCVYAWGSPAILTSIAVYMHRSATRFQMEEKRYILPTIFETRTCKQEYVFSINAPENSKEETYDALGSLFYFYLPVALLVPVNITCVLLIARKIRWLEVHNSLLETPSPPLRSMLIKYTKLIILTGAVEFVLEVTAWGARQREYNANAHWAFKHIQEKAFAFAIAVAFVDLLRVASMLCICVRGEWISRVWRWVQRKLHRRTDAEESPMVLEWVRGRRGGSEDSGEIHGLE